MTSFSTLWHEIQHPVSIPFTIHYMEVCINAGITLYTLFHSLSLISRPYNLCIEYATYLEYAVTYIHKTYKLEPH